MHGVVLPQHRLQCRRCDFIPARSGKIYLRSFSSVSWATPPAGWDTAADPVARGAAAAVIEDDTALPTHGVEKLHSALPTDSSRPEHSGVGARARDEDLQSDRGGWPFSTTRPFTRRF
jgi:hypothetical protein|eukprot:COSAG01_NODE_1147_length_11515_cov_38.979694_3_plen_118_part_00